MNLKFFNFFFLFEFLFLFSMNTHTFVDNTILPPTPNASDEEIEEEDVEILKQKSIKLQRRGTVSLADLIPLATAAHKAKHISSVLYSDSNENNSTFARALTKVKLGLQTHKLKEKYLTNEWIRLALAVPLDESNINVHINIQAKNTQIDYKKNNRTKEIVKWFEHKNKRTVLPLNELEAEVDTLRQRKLIHVQQQQELKQRELDFLSSFTTHNFNSLPSPPI